MLLTAMMPAHNAAPYIADAIDSVRAQSYQAWELVIVNDGSTDHTLEICMELAAADERIRVFDTPRGGRGVARNRCIAQARGEAIVFCDADDLSFPDRFQIHADHFASTQGLGISCPTRCVVFSDVRRVGDMYLADFPRTPGDIRRRLSKKRMPVHNAGAAIARWVFDEFGEYDARLQRAQDYHLFRRVVDHVEIQCTDVPLTLYRDPRRPFDWRYYWERKRYHWLADRLFGAPLERDGGALADGANPRPDLLFSALSALQFFKSGLAFTRARWRGLGAPDLDRVLVLLDSLGISPAVEDRRAGAHRSSLRERK